MYKHTIVYALKAGAAADLFGLTNGAAVEKELSNMGTISGSAHRGMQEKFLLKKCPPIAGRARNAAQAAGGEEYTVEHSHASPSWRLSQRRMKFAPTSIVLTGPPIS